MIRFMPDTIWDAIFRPLAMAMPNGWVYIEIIAPDFRFAFILALILAWVVLAARKHWVCSPAWVLLAFVSLCFVPWLYTTGNGRYFMPMLLAAGPLCVALINELPVTKNLRLFLVGGAVAVQAFAVVQNNPWNAWNSWGFSFWGEGSYFDVALDEEARTVPASYVTISVISYGLIAPLFPEQSRWLNISSQTGADLDNSRDSVRIQAFLKSSKKLKLMVPSLPDQMTLQGQPNTEAARSLNILLAPHRLGLVTPSDCRLQPSAGLAKVTGASRTESPKQFERTGFWLCSLNYPIAAPEPKMPKGPGRFDDIFQKLESNCPRFFTPGQRGSLPVPRGEMRHYQAADMRAYVFEDGTVYYKYHRALNPEYVGKAADLMSGKAVVDCNRIRGRSGLPWDREI